MGKTSLIWTLDSEADGKCVISVKATGAGLEDYNGKWEIAKDSTLLQKVDIKKNLIGAVKK